MRVHLGLRAGRARRTRDDERGVVAVLVAMFSVILMVMAAFAVDVGYALASKRQLSVAADAASLAAAEEVGRQLALGSGCSAALAALPTATTIASAEATAVIAANDLSNDSAVTSVSVSCQGTGATSALEVTVADSRVTPSFFGKVIGINNFGTASTATARYVRVPSASGLRPWVVCDGTAQLATQNPGVTYATGLDNKVLCAGSGAPGNWGAVDFNGGNNNAGDLAAWTLTGYPGSVTIPNAALPGDPGFTNSSALRAAFEAIVNDVVLFPTATGISGNGNNAIFNATGVVSVKVCGIQFGVNTYNTGSDCWDAAIATAAADDHIQFRAVNYTTSYVQNGSSPAGTCDFSNRLCVGATTLWR